MNAIKCSSNVPFTQERAQWWYTGCEAIASVQHCISFFTPLHSLPLTLAERPLYC